jgi:hypothetical protein
MGISVANAVTFVVATFACEIHRISQAGRKPILDVFMRRRMLSLIAPAKAFLAREALFM